MTFQSCDGQVDPDGQEILNDSWERTASEGWIQRECVEQPRQHHCRQRRCGTRSKDRHTYRESQTRVVPTPPDKRQGDCSESHPNTRCSARDGDHGVTGRTGTEPRPITRYPECGTGPSYRRCRILPDNGERCLFRNQWPPHAGGLGVAMQQKDRGTLAGGEVLQLESVHVCRAHSDRLSPSNRPLHGAGRGSLRERCQHQHTTAEAATTDHRIPPT